MVAEARSLQIATTLYVGLRMPTTTYVYDDAEHPDRVTSTIGSPAYTPQDRALLLGLALYESSLCDGCGQPKVVAWHSEMDGWYDVEKVVCHACSAIASKENGPTFVHDTRPAGHPPLPPFFLGETTTPASGSPSPGSSDIPREEGL